MPELLRLFIGIDVGDAWTTRLSQTADDLREDLGRAVRWVRPELYHVTVIFLGNQDPATVPEIQAAMAGAASTIQPFTLQLTELQRFGRHEHGALVAGVDDVSGRLLHLFYRLDGELRNRHFRFDAKKLVPHATLGRPRGRGAVLNLPPISFHDAPPLTVREIILVKSDLRQTGPVYETLASVRLGAGGTALPGAETETLRP